MQQQRARRLQPARGDLAACRIVPPANTVMPSPSPKSSAASSADVGTSVSAAMPRFYVAAPRPRQTRARSARLRSARAVCLDRRARVRARAARRTSPTAALSTALYLSLKLEKPLLLEGEAGVGKTEAAKAIAQALGARLIRLQCYEGLDVAHAVYEWNYARQLLHIRAAQEGTVDEAELFGPEFLIRRPLLEAVEAEEPVVLLIDEIDRADEEFEAFLLEVLSDFQITIPELGTIEAKQRPYVILTSNRTRELHDALKRRCLFHWIGHPSLEREIEIVKLRVPGVPERLAAEAAAFVAELRALDLQKPPGLAETIDWAQALTALGEQELDVENVAGDARLGAEVPRGPALGPRRDARGARRRRPCPRSAVVRHIVTFGRVLREAGLEVGPGRVADALKGSTRSSSTRQDDVYWTLRQTLVSRREDIEAFDRAFHAWFLARRGAAAGRGEAAAARAGERRKGAPPGPGPGDRRRRDDARRVERGRAAAHEGLRRR